MICILGGGAVHLYQSATVLISYCSYYVYFEVDLASFFAPKGVDCRESLVFSASGLHGYLAVGTHSILSAPPPMGRVCVGGGG